ncbi:hypothetical protein ACH4NC_29830 [Streptomyces sp. NPDC017201]|uniref:hypothetical protein n=1 Tax=unclassified Streptomyces TaxID=2593676 RepID=UPI0037A3F8C8
MSEHQGFHLSVALNGAGSHPAAPSRPFTPDAYARLVRGAEAGLLDFVTWFLDGGADGFRLRPAVLPDDLDAIVAGLVPVLQRRGLFRTGYTARTLRGHLALAAV